MAETLWPYRVLSFLITPDDLEEAVVDCPGILNARQRWVEACQSARELSEQDGQWRAVQLRQLSWYGENRSYLTVVDEAEFGNYPYKEGE